MSKLYFMVGLPGSGKTTYAKQLAKENDAIRFSSDDIRAEIGASGGDKSKHGEVFAILENRVLTALKNGQNAVYDATNISYKKRVEFVKKLDKTVATEKICIVMATPIYVCRNQNMLRDESVPLDVIERMYKNWWTPYYSEGWDSIFLNYNYDFYRTINGKLKPFCKRLYYLNQYNKHHQYGLGEHMMRVYDDLVIHSDKYDFSLFAAGLIHDCGKPYTQAFKDNGEACYYNHHNVGAYEAMFFDYYGFVDVDPIYVSFLVNHHMDAFFWGDYEKGKQKFVNTFGKNELKDILLLNQADRRCH